MSNAEVHDIQEKIQRFIRNMSFCVSQETLAECFLIKVSSLVYDLESLHKLSPGDISNILSQVLVSSPVLILLSKIKDPRNIVAQIIADVRFKNLGSYVKIIENILTSISVSRTIGENTTKDRVESSRVVSIDTTPKSSVVEICEFNEGLRGGTYYYVIEGK